MWKNKTISITMPAYNEEEGIYNTVRSFLDILEVDEVIVINNNSKDRTEELAKKAGARVVEEKTQGYGYACIKALKEAKGDYVILVESDNSFFPRDIYKFLSYVEDFDIIKGARSNDHLVSDDADWGPFLKYGNWFVAKLTQVLYNGPSMREAGGTYRIINRNALNKIMPHLTVGNSAFLPDMLTISLRLGLSVLELPVNYKSRKGISKITGNKWNAFKLGLNMIKIILWNRIKTLKKH